MSARHPYESYLIRSAWRCRWEWSDRRMNEDYRHWRRALQEFRAVMARGKWYQ